MKKILKKIINCKNDRMYRVVTFLGIKFKFKNSRRQIISEIGAVKSCCNTLLNEHKKMQEDIHSIQMQLTSILKTDINSIQNQMNEIRETGYFSFRYYENKLEREFLTPFFEYTERPDFSEKYLSLIRNLSNKDICEINKILARIQFIKNHPQQKRFNFFSLAEQQEKVKLLTDFISRRVRISEHLYAYGKYKLPIDHFEKCVFVYKHGIELIKNLPELRKKDFIDAGAFIGDSAMVLSDYTDKKIYSFEVNPNNLANMKKTIELNELSNVIPISKALWSSETELEFNLCGSASSLDKLHGIPYEENTIKVPTTTLDKFVEENNLNVGLIKVDLEGAEQEFLKGAEKTIKTQRPVLLLSIYHKPSDFFELKPILESWLPDYEFTVFNPVDYMILIETMIIAQPKQEMEI